MVGLQITEEPEPMTPTTRSHGGSHCATHASVGSSSIHREYFTQNGHSNQWMNLARYNYNVQLSYWQGGCSASEPSYGAVGGMAFTLRGQNQPPLGGEYVYRWAAAYRGADGGQTNGWYNYHQMHVRPVIYVYSYDSRIDVTDVQYKGFNKQSCGNTWPSYATDALAFIPLGYTGSVLASFATREYCTDNVQEYDWTGSNGEDYVGAYVYKYASNGQQEVAGRVLYDTYGRGYSYVAPISYASVTGQAKSSTGPATYFSTFVGDGAWARVQIV